MIAQRKCLWPVDLASQLLSIVVSMIAVMFLLPYFLSGRQGLAWVVYGINGLLLIIMVINLFAIVGRWQRTKQRVEIMRVYQSQALVHWRYDPTTWRTYAESEHRRAFRRLMHWLLPGVIMGSAIVSIWLHFFGQQILWPLLSAASLNLAVFLVKTGLLPYYRILNTAPEAIITLDGLWIAGTAHFWCQGYATLHGVNLQQGHPQVLEFNLRVQNGRTTSTQCMRIPVPAGCETEAVTVVAALTPK